MLPVNPHIIRLGAAWEPRAAGPGGVAGWLRRFGRPSGLRAADRVLLCWEPAAAGAAAPACTLNGSVLPAIARDASRFEHDVTSLLRERNELLLEAAHAGQDVGAVDVHGRADLPAAWGGVTLVIVTG